MTRRPIDEATMARWQRHAQAVADQLCAKLDLKCAEVAITSTWRPGAVLAAPFDEDFMMRLQRGEHLTDFLPGV